MGLAEWFSGFCGAIQIQYTGSISVRYKAITRRLNTDFWTTTSDTAHSLYVGSYGRNIAIQGFSDLDILFQLPYSIYQQYQAHAGNGQSALLQAVKTSIERTYSKTSIKADGQVILVPFTDGITFEVVPGFLTPTTVTHTRMQILAARGKQPTQGQRLMRFGRETRTATVTSFLFAA